VSEGGSDNGAGSDAPEVIGVRRGMFGAKGSGDTNLYRINPVTAAVTVVGNTGITDGGGLAFTPEPSSALALLAALAGAGMSRRRIRRSVHGAATA